MKDCGGLEVLQAVVDGVGVAGSEVTGQVVAGAWHASGRSLLADVREWARLRRGGDRGEETRYRSQGQGGDEREEGEEKDEAVEKEHVELECGGMSILR